MMDHCGIFPMLPEHMAKIPRAEGPGGMWECVGRCGIRSMLAEQIANICGNGFVSVAEDADGNADAGDARANTCGDDVPLRDTLHTEQKPTGPKALAGCGNALQCMGDGGAGAKPPLHISS